MTKDFVEITDLKKKRDAFFREAEEFSKTGAIVEALSKYNAVLNLGERIEDYSRHHEVYWGMCLVWYNHCLLCKSWSYLVDNFYNMALVYAPSEKQEEYKKIYNENLKSFNQEISNK